VEAGTGEEWKGVFLFEKEEKGEEGCKGGFKDRETEESTDGIRGLASW